MEIVKQMKRLGIFLIGLIPLFSVAQDEGQSLLWKVEKEGEAPSYVFGTIHVLPQSDFELDEKIRMALDESEELVLEMDMSDPTLQTRMMQMAAMSDGQTLDKLMSEEDYALLDKKLRKVAVIPLGQVSTYKPFMISTFLLSEYVGSQPASFELALMTMASQREMPISGLESLELQMAVFDSISYKSQAEDLLEMVRDSVEMRKLFRSMIEEYKAEDMTGLYATTEDYFDSEEEMEYLLYRRNREWVETINEKFGEKTYFIAVGAAHLGGDQGLIELLRKDGYRINAIMD